MSGKSNVIFWLERKGMTASDELVDRIFQRAKASDRCLTEEEILACCQKVFRQLLRRAPKQAQLFPRSGFD